MEVQAIGYVHSPVLYRYEAPRQPVFAEKKARIELLAGCQFEQAIADLAGFDRIWVIFVFHLNQGGSFKPMVRPPLSPDGGKYGVFSTRSPHRPNPIGLSAVELLELKGRTLYLGANDLLDGTPVLDIKPYIPEVDSFPESRAGWRDEVSEQEYAVLIHQNAQEKADWVLERSGLDLAHFARLQLRHGPLDGQRKRLSAHSQGVLLHCRTWALLFTVNNTIVEVLELYSNYRADELTENAPDPYGDKVLHREFLKRFSVIF